MSKNIFQRLWKRKSEWSQRTFGLDKDRGPVGALKHLELEAKEAYDEQDYDKRTVEIADCFLLVCDAARRHGLTLVQLIHAAEKKLAICEQRVWPAPSNDDTPTFCTHKALSE
jgi:hypothetical protein